MKLVSTIVIPAVLVFVSLAALSQEILTGKGPELPPLTPFEEFQLKNIPVKERPSGYATRDLPAVVDNSTQIFMRPVFNQDGYSCGQAAGIGYNFTYEINRARNLPADLIQNQYPTHFSWNFMNGGNGWYGVSYLHSFQILKHYGMPNVVDYGGSMSSGGPKRWMSGYTGYFNGMHNRINGFSQIYVEDEDDLQTLKGWLHDHLEGSSSGGVVSFYAQYVSANNQLPPGTPEAGKYVLTYFGGSANHAMTIVGYNDSIRWDYSGDGQYTNDVDINGDGVVTMKDWEIGGFKMVQSYGGVPNWGDDGYAYMMYKTIADDISEGGVWNHSVHLLDVKPDYEPELTARIIIKHDIRRDVKVITGLANNSLATIPEYRLDFPIFDYQGGYNYMQGGTDESDKTIEFGLDLSPLLTYVDPGQPVKFFLEVVEDDPSGSGTGQVNHFSVYDHTGTPIEIISPQVNVPVNNNDTTRLSLVHTMNFDRVTIQNESLPAAPQGEPFSCQMVASGGTTPYTWELAKIYDENSSTAAFPQITTNQLTPGNNIEGFVTQAIDFDFPFYDSTYNSITVHVDGYLMFDEQLYPYPYFNDDEVLFRKTRNISPFMNQYQQIYPGGGDGIWYEGNSDYAIFRWKTSIENSSVTDHNYAVKIYPSGNIEFYYGEMDSPGDNLWLSGISDGDDENMHKTGLSNLSTVPENTAIELEKYDYPDEFTLTPSGLFTGIPQQNYAGIDITFKVIDNNFIKDFKTLTLASSGVVVRDSVTSGDDQIIEFGETANVSVMVSNIENDTIYNAIMTMTVNDPFITLIDSIEDLGNLPPSQVMRFEDAFAFEVSPDIPNNHVFTLESVITDGDSTWENNLFHTAHAPVIGIYEVLVNDENNRLDPGDTADLVITYFNTGGAAAENIFTVLDTQDPLVEILDNFSMIVSLGPNQQEQGEYSVYVSEDALNGHPIEFTTALTGDNSFAASDTFNLTVGFQVEDFESGNFEAASWGFKGKKSWRIDTDIVYEGNFSARSGFITHEQETSMIIDLEVNASGEISFFKKVSCEDDESANNNYDFLAFMIDGVEMGRWDGDSDWSLETYPVEAGFHRFEWRYRKDLSQSSLMDGAWIDYIVFPGAQDVAPVIACNKQEIEMLMRPGEIGYDTLLITNGGPGAQEFDIHISSMIPSLPDGGTRNILGSYLICPQKYLHTMKSYTWTFTLYNASQDSEWIKDLFIDLPPGLQLVSTTDFVGGSNGDLIFEGDLGNGALAHWHGEDGSNWGVLKGNETATAELTLFALEGLPEDITMSYEVHGDIYGTEPHVIDGEIDLVNLGYEPGWIALDTNHGSLTGGSSAQVVVTINTEGMGDGVYESRLLVHDYFSEAMEIPVTLTVDQTLAADEIKREPGEGISLFPNPSSGPFTLNLPREIEEPATISILSVTGKVVERIHFNRIPSGKLFFDLNEYPGLSENGIYIFEMRSGEMVFRKKLLFINEKN